MEIIHTIGRRKTSVARLYFSEGKGNITVNKKRLQNTLPHLHVAVQDRTADDAHRN